MAKTENKKVASSREKLLSRANTRYPDKTFKGQKTQDGQDGQDDLEDALSEMLDDYDAKISEYKANNDKLVQLFVDDPRSAELVTRWVKTGDPFAAIVEVFGDDFLEAMKTPEGRSRYVESHNAWLAKKNEEDAASAKRDENWDKSLNDLDSWGDSQGLSDQEKIDIILRLHKVGQNAMDNIYTIEDFEMAKNAMNYSKDVENARREGEVAGKNAKIEARRRDRTLSESMPPSLNGQGGMVPERKKPEANSPWAGLK